MARPYFYNGLHGAYILHSADTKELNQHAENIARAYHLYFTRTVL